MSNDTFETTPLWLYSWKKLCITRSAITVINLNKHFIKVFILLFFLTNSMYDRYLSLVDNLMKETAFSSGA